MSVKAVTARICFRGILPSRPTRGIFAVSTFGAVIGVSERDIARAMKLNRFARTTYGDLRGDFAVYRRRWPLA